MSDWALEKGAPGEGWAFIQWKGTDVCMDLTCLGCGTRLHVDDDFAYAVECVTCGTFMEMSCYVSYRKIDDPVGASVIGMADETCEFCRGRGFDQILIQSREGTSYIPGDACPECNGTGRVEVRRGQ